MFGFYCIVFIQYMFAGKTSLDYSNLFSLTDYKKINMAEEPSLNFRLRNYFLDEIKHNDLMYEKYKKTCKYLSYVEHLLILMSTVTGCVSISVFV